MTALLRLLAHHCEIVGGGDGADGGFLILAVGIEGGGEIVAAGDDVLLQIVHRQLRRLQIALVAEVAIAHDERGGGAGRGTAGGINVAVVVAILAGEVAVALLQVEHVVEQRAHLLFPLRVLAAVLLLVVQVVEHGIDRLRLLADAMHNVGIGGDALCNAHLVLEIALLCKTICQPAIENGAAHLHQPLLARLLAILQRVEGIEQHATAEAQLHVVGGQAVVAAQANARVVFQVVLVDVCLAEVVSELCLHLRGGVERCERLWAQLVDGHLPGRLHKLTVVARLTFAHEPR